MEYTQPGGSCVTVNVCPPIVSVPVRELVVELAKTEYVTVKVPLPGPSSLPDLIVIKLELLVAVQLPLQRLGEPVTVTVPDVALALTD
jgi:hypothetical protein